jgi:hypothetical protein
MQPSTDASAEIYFTDLFKVTPEVLDKNKDIVLIDARIDNKPSGSKA